MTRRWRGYAGEMRDPGPDCTPNVSPSWVSRIAPDTIERNEHGFVLTGDVVSQQAPSSEEWLFL
jgi:hypothetical protein